MRLPHGIGAAKVYGEAYIIGSSGFRGWQKEELRQNSRDSSIGRGREAHGLETEIAEVLKAKGVLDENTGYSGVKG